MQMFMLFIHHAGGTAYTDDSSHAHAAQYIFTKITPEKRLWILSVAVRVPGRHPEHFENRQRQAGFFLLLKNQSGSSFSLRFFAGVFVPEYSSIVSAHTIKHLEVRHSM